MGELNMTRVVIYSVFMTVVILLADIGVFTLIHDSGLSYDMQVGVFTAALFAMMFGTAKCIVDGVEE
jgi:hypothetical protein